MRPRMFTSVIGFVLLMSAVTLTAGACSNDRHRGPAERAGAKVDRAADKTGDAVEDAGRKVNRALPGD
jgi:hypothetical protein